jgi:hypothetical protein
MLVTISITLHYIQNFFFAGHRWLTPVIVATWAAEIGRIKVLDQLGQIV